jgi:hypothetical protein
MSLLVCRTHTRPTDRTPTDDRARPNLDSLSIRPNLDESSRPNLDSLSLRPNLDESFWALLQARRTRGAAALQGVVVCVYCKKPEVWKEPGNE